MEKTFRLIENYFVGKPYIEVRVTGSFISIFYRINRASLVFNLLNNEIDIKYFRQNFSKFRRVVKTKLIDKNFLDILFRNYLA
jgi:hypothetical protein